MGSIFYIFGGNRIKASYDQVLSWVECSLDGVKIETVKNSCDACGISHRRCDLFFNDELKKI